MDARKKNKNGHALISKKEAGLGSSLKKIELKVKKCPKSPLPLFFFDCDLCYSYQGGKREV
jgi:hypothetical protein